MAESQSRAQRHFGLYRRSIPEDGFSIDAFRGRFGKYSRKNPRNADRQNPELPDGTALYSQKRKNRLGFVERFDRERDANRASEPDFPDSGHHRQKTRRRKTPIRSNTRRSDGFAESRVFYDAARKRA